MKRYRALIAAAFLLANVSGCTCASPYRMFQNGWGFADAWPEAYRPGPPAPRPTPPGSTTTATLNIAQAAVSTATP
ncbi:MAG TPA: hypothetical protein VHV08_04310 [Pirellulales bacterium]|jgi:hypothetical protein|nr:hypothetical protein [Pirellulales bacterium]